MEGDDRPQATLAAVNVAIERMVSPLAVELAPVRVNAVSPGRDRHGLVSFLPDDQRSAQFAQVAGSVPVNRVGVAADAICYLIEASFVTATVLPVDGGVTVA